MAERPTVLVVDDDPHLREIVRFALEQGGFRVDEAADGRAALTQVDRALPALIVLDIMMPELDGLAVCREVRRKHELPIVFLSSRDDEVDRILGLELGGDDYLTKPFSPRELVARVKAVLRRARPAPVPEVEAPAARMQSRGPLRMDAERWRAWWQDTEVVLTVTEFQLLATLLRVPGKVFTRDELMNRVYDDVVVSDRTIDSHVRRVRQKFASAGGDVIETVHGLGYRLALPERRARPRLWLVFAAVGIAGFALTLAGLAFVRVYDNQLIRQTESELIAQGAVVAEVFRERLRATVPEGAYGRERTAPWPFPIPDDTRLRPILPSLRASDASLPPGDTPRPSRVPAEPLSQAAGLQLTPLLEQVRAATLAGIRVVDTEGVVVASSSPALLWTTLADRTEVQRALRGEPVSVLRRRVADPEDTPLASLSRDTGIRVTVALPVLEGDRVWGAVVLTRTPMTFAKATYADRWNLTATGFVLLGAVALMSLAAAALVGRPVRALVKQTRAIAMSDPSGFEPMARPVVAELAELSESLAGMATALRDRNQYIRSFAANVSHEFKTPLASIQGAVELLRDSADAMAPEQRARFLANVDADARRLTRLVQRLLELARADSMTATPAQVELGPLLEGSPSAPALTVPRTST
ncbi:response regulator [Myxococcus sp. MxC21-1]|uniref:response regulator n=1 Tax=Myxococcus sp. MxC21-1 TaxID=3041439 RepID=UPI00292E16C2|nr:response regulator [Myxococcus sp. MxC21-1]WNZ58857.1 response regulator [Myxococcus sp. MxC21-1]